MTLNPAAPYLTPVYLTLDLHCGRSKGEALVGVYSLQHQELGYHFHHWTETAAAITLLECLYQVSRVDLVGTRYTDLYALPELLRTYRRLNCRPGFSIPLKPAPRPYPPF